MLALLLFSIADAQVDPILAIAIDDDFMNDPTIRGFFADVLAQGGHGNWKKESAAFVVKDESGEYRCFSWPSDGRLNRQEFSGAIPDGTVAILHTHPKEIPTASPHDVRTAQRFHVPIFVLTPRYIYLITSRGEIVTVVSNQRWNRNATPSSMRCTTPRRGPVRPRLPRTPP